MKGYRLEVEVNMSWDGWTQAAISSVLNMEEKYGKNNITTTMRGLQYQIWVKI